jgi:hypothetical protein
MPQLLKRELVFGDIAELARIHDIVDRFHCCAHGRRDCVLVIYVVSVEHAIRQCDPPAKRGKIVMRKIVIALLIARAASRG